MSKKLNLGLIGAGRIGRVHAGHLAYRIPEARLVMVADVNRYGVPREDINRQLEDLGLNPHQLFNAHKHLIKTESGKPRGKTLNPIKASKRRV